MQELKTSLGRTYLTIDTDAANKWIAVNWQGYLTADSIQEGARAYTAALAKSEFACVLNDTRAVRGPWDHSMDWVINEWAPNAAAAGLKYFALISTPETLADGSAANFYAQLKAFHADVVSTTPDAEQWLRNCQQRS